MSFWVMRLRFDVDGGLAILHSNTQERCWTGVPCKGFTYLKNSVIKMGVTMTPT